MPSWVKDESIWEKAKDAFHDSYDKEPSSDKDYAILTTIYKNMGGTVAELMRVVVRQRHAGMAMFLYRKAALSIKDVEKWVESQGREHDLA